ncbi:unnamed protein product [Caenorhabditis bovis]|uniref:Costars domain-containing protein n=1 Tax=Caenorhabditis bovis TaxID=2654633 RepID=A0A8S1F9N7_9PELO|nr:unnamed protein product [Caenorhabditis bovis]
MSQPMKEEVEKTSKKEANGYGRPPEGSLSDQRAKKAASHVAREMLQLCEIIEDFGRRKNADEPIRIDFGSLFRIYTSISDKVVGTLLRARKHGMVTFEGEMLFQGRDDKVVISLILEGDKLQEQIQAHAAANPQD